MKKVMESIDREREFSQAMRNTPRKRRFDHALRGYWDRFPVSPEPDAKRSGAHFQSKTLYSKNASFGISEPWTSMRSKRRSCWKRARQFRPRCC